MHIKWLNDDDDDCECRSKKIIHKNHRWKGITLKVISWVFGHKHRTGLSNDALQTRGRYFHSSSVIYIPLP